MKVIEEDKFEVVVPPFLKPMNDVQKRLHAVLDLWGPNGERYFSGICDDDVYGRVCVINALQIIYDHRLPTTFPELEPLFIASQEQCHWGVVACSDSSFANARKMVLRAIELSSSP